MARAAAAAEATAAQIENLKQAINLGTATEADIRKAGLLLRDNFGYQLGLDAGSAEAPRGDPSVWSAVDGNKRYGVEIAATAFLKTQLGDPTQNSERYQLFSMGTVLRSDSSGTISRVAVEFGANSSYLAESMNISAQEARAKVDWQTYKTMVDAAFSTIAGQGINATRVHSLQISGVWRPGYSEFQAYFSGGNNGGATQMATVMSTANIGPGWSNEHSTGKALDISRINGIAVNSSGQTTQPGIIKQFSYELAQSGASKVLQPWMVKGIPQQPTASPPRIAVPNVSLEHDFVEPNAVWRSAIKHSDHLHFKVN